MVKYIYQDILLYGLQVSFILYIIAFIGISSMVPKYLNVLRNILKLFMKVKEIINVRFVENS